MFNIAEKRKFPRLTINADVTYTMSSAANSQYAGFCKNLSHTGILFVTGQKLSPGDSVVVTLDTKSSNFQPLKAKIEVVRTEPSEDKFAIAGKIVEYQ